MSANVSGTCMYNQISISALKRTSRRPRFNSCACDAHLPYSLMVTDVPRSPGVPQLPSFHHCPRHYPPASGLSSQTEDNTNATLTLGSIRVNSRVDRPSNKNHATAGRVAIFTMIPRMARIVKAASA